MTATLRGSFFKYSAVSASITGIHEGLINRFRVILQVLSSGQEIGLPSSENFCLETKIELEELYPWCDMSPTVHKLLEHSSQIIGHHLVPIGELTEEAQESRNKDCRRFREHHTRKIFRENTNRELLTILLVSSDPVIASLRRPPKKTTERFDSQVMAFLKSSMPTEQLLNLSLRSKKVRKPRRMRQILTLNSVMLRMMQIQDSLWLMIIIRIM